MSDKSTEINPDSLVFPTYVQAGEATAIQGGLQLRDYFAAQALSALVSLYYALEQADYVAVAAYRYADALLEARKK